MIPRSDSLNRKMNKFEEARTFSGVFVESAQLDNAGRIRERWYTREMTRQAQLNMTGNVWLS